MRQVLALGMTLVFVLGLAGAALAQGSQQPSGGSSAPSSSAPAPASPSPSGSSTDTTKSTAPSGTTGKSDPMGKPDATKTDKSTVGKPADKAAGRGQHKMMGEVTKIDSTKGMVTLKTDEGSMDLHFPPSALQGIKEGDRVEVQLAIRPAGAAGAGSKPAAGKSSPGATKTDDASKGSGKAPASTGTPQQPKTQ